MFRTHTTKYTIQLRTYTTKCIEMRDKQILYMLLVTEEQTQPAYSDTHETLKTKGMLQL